MLKNSKNLLGVFHTLEIFNTISVLNKNFFKNGHRFCKEVWPLLKIFIEKSDLNLLETYLGKKICKSIKDFISDINLFQDKEFSLPCCLQAQEEVTKDIEYLKTKKIVE